MEKKHHTIDDLFNEKLANFEVEPPAYVLDNIHSKLDAKAQKKRFIFWFSFAATVAIIVSFGAGYLISTVQTSRSNTIANSAESSLNHQQIHPIVSETNRTKEEQSAEGRPSNDYENQPLMNRGSAENAISESSSNEGATSKQNENLASVKTPVFSAQKSSSAAHSQPSVSEKKITDNVYVHSKKQNVAHQTATTKNTKIVFDTPVIASNKKTDVRENTPVQNEPILNNNAETVTQGNAEESVESVTLDNDESVVVNENKTVEEPIDELNNALDKKRSMSIKAYFSPIMPIMNASANQDRFYSATASGNTFKNSPEFSYGLGFDIGYDINKNWSISLGFAYNQIGMSTHRSSLQMQKFGGDENPDGFLSDVYTSTGRIEGLSVYQDVAGGSAIFNTDKGEIGNTLSISQRFGFIEVPIKAQYKHTWGRVSVLATAGLSTGFLVRNQAYAVGDESRTYIGEGGAMNNVNFNAIIGTGIEVRILPFLSFAVEPMFRYSFVNWSKDTENGFKVKPMFVNLNTGLIFKL